jgi:TRAP-type transport system small permease protein
VSEEAKAEPQRGITGALSRVCFVIGAVGLLIAMATDAIAVVGRHAKLPLLGSIEIVQACIVMAASAAMVGATVAKGHAAVHILIERVPPMAAKLLERLSNLIGAVVAAGLFAGSIWIVADLWNGAERTELLGMPLKPLRLFWCASAALMAVIFLIRAVAPGRNDPAAAEPDDAV